MDFNLTYFYADFALLGTISLYFFSGPASGVLDGKGAWLLGWKSVLQSLCIPIQYSTTEPIGPFLVVPTHA